MGAREMKERAAKLVAAGQLERAEVVLRQTLTTAPRDVQVWLRHAEVLKKLGRNDAAVSSYRLAGRILDEGGHHERAVAALKLALALAPDDVDVYAEIIRSELRAHRTTAGLRSVFSLSSPAQLLSGPAVRESGIYSGVPGMGLDDVPPVRLALPMSTSATVSVAQPRTMAAAAGSDTWSPEPTPSSRSRVEVAPAPEVVRPPPPVEGEASIAGAVPDAAAPAEPPSPPTPAEEPPPPRASAPVRFEVESIERWPQVRRLSETRVAIRTAPEAPWVVVEAASPITVGFVPLLDVPEEAEWLE